MKRKLKRKKTIDPQDTVEATNLQFLIEGKEIEIKETKEKLEEYQEKMRKTQLRYYVFKKIRTVLVQNHFYSQFFLFVSTNETII